MASERCAMGQGAYKAGGGVAGAHSAEGHLEADSRGLCRALFAGKTLLFIEASDQSALLHDSIDSLSILRVNGMSASEGNYLSAMHVDAREAVTATP